MNGYEMNVEERQEYLFTKLTDGSYTQGYCQLRTRRVQGAGFDHCCLGVSCDVFLELTGEGEWRGESLFRVEDDSSKAVMPQKVANFFGFKRADSEYLAEDGHPTQLTSDNDAEEPFSAIVETMRNPDRHVFK